jgi:hypothetical protein
MKQVYAIITRRMKDFNKIITPAAFIILAVATRIFPHAPNFTPIAATALFGATYLPKKYAFIIPIAAMFISDYFIGFHSLMPYVYGSFIVSGLIGLWIREHKNVTNIIGATLLSSILFFLVTNFGVWADGAYARGLDGLIESYVMGIPFFRDTVAGDLFYVTLFFGSYEFVKNFVYGKALAFKFWE